MCLYFDARILQYAYAQKTTNVESFILTHSSVSVNLFCQTQGKNTTSYFFIIGFFIRSICSEKMKNRKVRGTIAGERGTNEKARGRKNRRVEVTGHNLLT